MPKHLLLLSRNIQPFKIIWDFPFFSFWGDTSFIVVFQSLSRVRIFVTPWTIACQSSSVHGISQARILEWVAISSSRRSPQLSDWTHISCIGRWILYHWATREAHLLSYLSENDYLRFYYNNILDIIFHLKKFLIKIKIVLRCSSHTIYIAHPFKMLKIQCFLVYSEFYNHH